MKRLPGRFLSPSIISAHLFCFETLSLPIMIESMTIDTIWLVYAWGDSVRFSFGINVALLMRKLKDEVSLGSTYKYSHLCPAKGYRNTQFPGMCKL